MTARSLCGSVYISVCITSWTIGWDPNACHCAYGGRLQLCCSPYFHGQSWCSAAHHTRQLSERAFPLRRYLISPREDVLELDVFISEAVMPQSVLLLGQPKLVKALLKDEDKKIGKYAKLMQVCGCGGLWLAGAPSSSGCKASQCIQNIIKDFGLPARCDHSVI